MKYLLSIVVSVVLSTSVMLGLVHTVPPVHQDVQVVVTQPKTIENFDQIRQATRVWKGDLGQCSGVMIDAGWMLTAAHCDQEGKKVNDFDVILVKKDVTRDLMLLRVIDKCPCVPLGYNSPKISSKVYIVGFPANKDLGVQYLTEGRWQGLLHTPEGFDIPLGYFAATSVPAFFGNSGGGLFQQDLEGNWKLHGIVSFMLFAPTMSGVSTTESIIDFLKGF